MKKSLLKGLAAFAVMAALMVSCTPANGGGSGGSGGSSGTTEVTLEQKSYYYEVSGNNISKNTTWDFSDEITLYYINTVITVKKGAVLNITGNKAEYHPIKICFGPEGRLIVAEGASINAKDASFYSYRQYKFVFDLPDDEPDAAANDWQGMWINGGSATFTNCEIKNSGKNDTSAILIENGGKARIEKCIIEENGGTYAVRYGKTAAPYDAETNSVSNSSFKNNVWGLSIPFNFSLDNTNIYSRNKETLNVENVPITSNVNWDAIIHYNLCDSEDYVIKDGGCLTIKGGSGTWDLNNIEVASATIVIEEGGKLNVDNYIDFTSTAHSKDTDLWGGIRDENTQKFYDSKTGGSFWISFLYWEKKSHEDWETVAIPSTLDE
ncbi:MAG: hypothetical protein MJ162_01620 [Treponema sp.]|nr:hypothetical protein [Treponema sp.]